MGMIVVLVKIVLFMEDGVVVVGSIDWIGVGKFLWVNLVWFI